MIVLVRKVEELDIGLLEGDPVQMTLRDYTEPYSIHKPHRISKIGNRIRENGTDWHYRENL